MTVAASRASNPKDQQALAASGRPTGATLSPGDALLAPGARSMALVDDGPLLLLQPALPAATPTGLTTVLSSEMLRGESYKDAQGRGIRAFPPVSAARHESAPPRAPPTTKVQQNAGSEDVGVGDAAVRPCARPHA